jgi:hypothetical protein
MHDDKEASSGSGFMPLDVDVKQHRFKVECVVVWVAIVEPLQLA